MRPHVASRVLVLSSVSLAQAAAFNPRYERNIGNQNLADAVKGVLDLLGDKKTVTETMIHTITVGAAPAGGAGLNATSGVTMTVTAPASTATPCPGQAQGAVQGAEGGNSTSAPPAGAVSSGAAPVADVPHGGIGVKIIPVPSGAGAAGPVANPPAVSQPSVSQPQPVISQSAAPSGGINTTSTLAPLPSQPGLIQPPGVSTTSSEQSLSALPSLQTPPGLTSSAASSTIGGAPTSSTSASTSASTLGRLPDLPSSLAPTINLGAAGAAVATPPPNPGGAFGGIVGMIPIGSATRPPVANGTGTGPTINVSGLKLTSRLTLGDLVKPTGAAAA